MNISKFRDSDVPCAHGEKSIGRFTFYFMVVQTKTYAALVWTISKSISDKKNNRRKKRQFHSKIVILDVETTFHIHFLSSELQCLPRGDPENLCENTKIQLLITHLFPQNFKNQVVRIKIVLRIYFYAPIWYRINSLKETSIICFKFSRASSFKIRSSQLLPDMKFHNLSIDI